MENSNHIGKTLKLDEKNNKRCCYKLESSFSPTAVSKDKKQYSVFCKFDMQRKI